MSRRLYGRKTADGVQRSVFISQSASGLTRADHSDRYPTGECFAVGAAELFDTEAEAVASQVAAGYTHEAVAR